VLTEQAASIRHGEADCAYGVERAPANIVEAAANGRFARRGMRTLAYPEIEPMQRFRPALDVVALALTAGE